MHWFRWSNIRLREIRRIFNVAIRDKVIPQELYPFSTGNEAGKVKIPQAELNKTDQYLTLDSLKLMAGTTFKNHVLERTKHLFLFSYYSRGMNWKDMALLTGANFYRATVVDEKTHQNREVTMMQYKRSNASLKKIAKQLTFPESQQNITIYTARHSFAMTLKNKDKSIEIISQALGISP